MTIPSIYESEDQPSPDLEQHIRTAKKAWKELKLAKQNVARQFKDHKDDPDALIRLREEMQEASAAVAEAESYLKALRKKAEEQKPIPRPAPQFPARMTMHPAEAELPAGIRFEMLSEKNVDEWDAYVAANDRATLYHFSRWEKIICRVMRQRSMCTLARAQGRIVGILPLYRLTSKLFGDFAVSVPYLNYGGPLGESGAIERALLENAQQQGAQLGLSHVEVRELQDREGWPNLSHKVSMLLQLPTTAEQLFDQVGTKVRAQIKRGEREGHVVSIGGVELLDGFYDVFARNMRDLGTPVYSKAFFAEILKQFPDNAELVVVTLEGKPVGCAFLIRYSGVQEIPWASTIRESNRSGSNMFMYWRMLCRAIETGCEYFDFGRSSPDAGTFSFKKQWGAKPIQLVWNYVYLWDSQLPELRPDSPKFRLLVSIWQRLPVALTKILGPVVVRNLP